MADVLTGATDRREYFRLWRIKNRERHRIYHREWARANPEKQWARKNPEQNRINRAAHRMLLRAAADGERARGCIDCGEKDLRVIEFDHVRGIKKSKVGGFLNSGSLARLYSEIDKCDVRCANCHARITAIRRKDCMSG